MIRRIGYLLAFILGLAVGKCFGADPASEVRACLTDLRSQPLPQTQRYLTSYALPPELQATAPKALSLVLNSVSRSSRIAQPVRVTDTLYRIDLAAYGIQPALWESLVSTQEPYWHTRAKERDRYGKVIEVVRPGAWLPQAEFALLVQTSGSVGAVARLDWFCAKVASTPNYYQWAGIEDTLDGFRKQFGADEKTILALQANKGENVLHSGVTSKVRRVSRWQGPLGAQWITHDSEGVDPAKDFIRNPTFTAGVDAHEIIAAKPNGLLSYALYDGNGKRADVVPDKIARDHSDVLGDQRLVPMMSCVRCHAADGGYRRYATDQTDLLKAGAKLVTADPKTAAELAAFYDAPKLARQFARDVEDYQSAVKEATGLDAKDAAKALDDVFNYHENIPLNVEAAARELGLRDTKTLAASSDGILASLLLGKKVTRRQFENSWPEAISRAVATP